MKQKIKFYLPCNLLNRDTPPPALPSQISEDGVLGGRFDFEAEVECVSPSLFQDAIGSMGGGVYQVDVGDIPDYGITPQDNQINRMWESVESEMREMMCALGPQDDEEEARQERILGTLDELREIYS